MLLFTTAFLFASTLSNVVEGQGMFPRAFQMAIQNGFSPFHPARINHETLPISQAEFAQLVAESMATSRGPHHHHPPNTDANYEEPGHAAHDAELLKSSPSEGHYSSYHHPGHHHHHHHYAHPHQHNHLHSVHPHHNHQLHSQLRHHANLHSQYQPDDHYNEQEDGYHRSPVYQQEHEHEQQRQQKQTQQEEEELEDEPEEEAEAEENYGGRRPASSSQRHKSASAEYRPSYESQRSAYLNSYEEDNHPMHDQYMAAASEHLPIKIIPLKH